MSNSLLVIGKVWPEPKASAAGSRILQIIRSFIDRGWDVQFGSTSKKNPGSEDLSAIGVKELSLELNSGSFDELIMSLKPKAVLFDRFMTEEQFGWRVSEYSPNSLRILDTEDLHCLRETRRKALISGTTLDLELLRGEKLAIREIASIYRSDLSLMISEFEMATLTDVFKIDRSLIHYLPFLVDVVPLKETMNWKPFSERKHFITIGNFLHPPNVDSIRFLKERIWPIIRERIPDAEMHVYGAYASDQHLKLSKPDSGFLLKGFAESVDSIMSEARVCLAPLRFGAGLKGKLLDAMLNGTPSVTTSIGAEGMNGEHSWPGQIEDDPGRFAEAAVALYQGQQEWNMAQGKISTLVGSRFVRTTHECTMHNRIEALINGIDQHRLSNFNGRMLNHHTMRSTEFMSRWIEAKNQILGN